MTEEDDALDDGLPGGDMGIRIVEIGEDLAGVRLDKALADRCTEFSRARIQGLMAEGLVRRDGSPVTDGAAKAKLGLYELLIPPPAAAEPQPEAIPLDVLFEDEHLIVIVKPAGMAAHPAPGSETGTLVNALLRHCGDSLSGIGGVARPGIVHRLDKETSGVMVAAKTDPAHQGLAALFARHDIERLYTAFVRGAPRDAGGTVNARLGRSQHDRKKMAILKTGGREAVTHWQVQARYGPTDKPMAARLACRLETGRTHQIRVHLASLGHPCLADPVYGSGQPAAPVRAAIEAAALTRQALHASVLGFVHPITGETLRFETELPADLAILERELAEL